MFETLVPPNFLFQFAVPCHYLAGIKPGMASSLTERYTLPWFGQLEGKTSFATLRAAWSETGMLFWLKVQGKKQALWCRDSRLEESDGMTLFLDTRNTKTIHRAGRFCHRLGFFPLGAGRKLDEPVAALLAINRARESPRELEPGSLKVRAERYTDGYTLEAFVGSDALTGYSPQDQPQIGFAYAVQDRELGLQTMTLGPEFPFDEDPSLWATLDLVK